VPVDLLADDRAPEAQSVVEVFAGKLVSNLDCQKVLVSEPWIDHLTSDATHYYSAGIALCILNQPDSPFVGDAYGYFAAYMSLAQGGAAPSPKWTADQAECMADFFQLMLEERLEDVGDYEEITRENEVGWRAWSKELRGPLVE